MQKRKSVRRNGKRIGQLQ